MSSTEEQTHYKWAILYQWQILSIYCPRELKKEKKHSPIAPSDTAYHPTITSLFFPPFIFIIWRLITLHYCSGFCHTLTWISHGFTCTSLLLILLRFPWRRDKNISASCPIYAVCWDLKIRQIEQSIPTFS